nr:hypothetical protein [Tanacetum cinerariifolium]
MTGNLKLLTNFVEKFLGSMKFGNDQIAPVLGYGDMVQGTVTIKRVYYVEGLNHNSFFVGQFCDADLEVAFRKSTFYIRDLKGNDLRTDHPCSSCELGKAKRKSFQTKTTPSSKIRLQLLHMDLSGPMWVESINGKKYVFVIVDDYSRYTWTNFLRSKDETPEVLINFLRLVQRGLHAQVRIVRTDKGTEFLNKTLHAYFASEGIHHQTSVARTPEQNGVVERRNRTLVEAARTMLSAAKKPSVKFFHIFGSPCYIVRDGENLDKMKEKDHVSSDPVPQCQRTALEHNSLSLGPQSQDNVPQADGTVTTSNELDLLFSLMFDELLNGSAQVVSKSSTVTTAHAPNKSSSESRPPMLNKENYVPWSSRLLRYAKSKPNGKLIHNSIINGPYVRRMIPEPGDINRDVPVNETFHVQTNDELTEKELKQIEADDQAIQTILLGLPEDIYAVVDSCKTAQEIWLRVQQMMKGSNIGI